MKHKNIEDYRKWLDTDNNWAFYDKADFSFSAPRTEIIEIMKLWEGMDILEVGCADGKTLKILKEDHGANTYGVEPDKKLAEKAGKYSTVFNTTIEKYLEASTDVKDKKFDAILMADVIEHLLEPWTVVRELGSRLKDGGFIYASIPNFFNAAVMYNLFAHGSFAYESYCIVNKDHIRFFTVKDSLNLFNVCGLKPVLIGGIDLPLPKESLDKIKRLGKVFGRDDYNFEVYQFVIKAGK